MSTTTATAAASLSGAATGTAAAGAATGTAAASVGAATRTTSQRFHWPSMCTIQRYVKNAIKLLGRIGAGAIVFFALAHFVPELRVEMPNFYRIVDFVIDSIEWLYTQFWAIIT